MTTCISLSRPIGVIAEVDTSPHATQALHLALCWHHFILGANYPSNIVENCTVANVVGLVIGQVILTNTCTNFHILSGHNTNRCKGR